MPRVILVTGANTGIGFELVRLLAEQQHTVYLGARKEAAGREAECVLDSCHSMKVLVVLTMLLRSEDGCMQKASSLSNLCILM